MKYTVTFFSMLIILIALDALWLGVIAKSFYSQHLSYLMASKIKWHAAVIFYLMYIIALIYFVVNPYSESSLIVFLLSAAGFGLVTYGTYDLVNLATIKNWPEIVVWVDCSWGMILTMLVSWFGRWVFLRF